MSNSRNHGFTLLEAMIAVAIIGILLTIALPAFSHAVAAGKTLTLRTALVGALMESRTAAVVSGSDTILCPSSDGEYCDNSFEWQQGFIAAIDLNNNETIDDRDRRVFYRSRVEDVRLVTSVGRKRIQFQPNGTNAGSNATFTFCDDRGPTRATSLVMNNRGDLREVKPTATATAAACRI